MQKLMGLMRRCIEDYHMIEAGDRIAVGVSFSDAAAVAGGHSGILSQAVYAGGVYNQFGAAGHGLWTGCGLLQVVGGPLYGDSNPDRADHL